MPFSGQKFVLTPFAERVKQGTDLIQDWNLYLGIAACFPLDFYFPCGFL